MATRSAVLALAFVVVFAGSSAAQERKSLQVFNDISTEVNRYTQFTIFDSVEASIADGHVVLTGWVMMPFKKTDIERRVAKVDGVRLSGVRKDGAAEKAGMAKGDVITRMGEREIHNLDDYMAAFAEMKPDVAIPVTVMRDGKAVELTLVPQAPKAR